jgi:hypothetical protein
MNWFALAIGGLVVFRLALLVSSESGPAFIFRKLRRLPPKKSSLKEGLSCPWCLGMHFSIPVTAYEWWLGMFPTKEIPLYWLAISSVAIIINQQWTKGSH